MGRGWPPLQQRVHGQAGATTHGGGDGTLLTLDIAKHENRPGAARTGYARLPDVETGLTLALTPLGKAYARRYNGDGELGNGATANSSVCIPSMRPHPSWTGNSSNVTVQLQRRCNEADASTRGMAVAYDQPPQTRGDAASVATRL